jgi:transmembrane protein
MTAEPRKALSVSTDEPSWVAAVLNSAAFGLLARILLTFTFWMSAAQKLLDSHGALAEMQMFHLNPPGPYAIATTIVQVVGVGLIVWGRYVWLGAGVLAVFTALTIPIAHPFWQFAPPRSIDEAHQAYANVTIVGALLVAALWAHERRRRSA